MRLEEIQEVIALQMVQIVGPQSCGGKGVEIVGVVKFPGRITDFVDHTRCWLRQKVPNTWSHSTVIG